MVLEEDTLQVSIPEPIVECFEDRTSDLQPKLALLGRAQADTILVVKDPGKRRRTDLHC